MAKMLSNAGRKLGLHVKEENERENLVGPIGFRGATIIPTSVENGAIRPAAERSLANAPLEQGSSTERIVDFAYRRSLTSKLDFGESDSGRPYAHLSFPRHKRNDQIIDASFLLDLPNLSKPFFEGILELFQNKSPRTRCLSASALKTGFVRYLKNYHSLATIDDLDVALLNDYVRWQRSPAASADGVHALCPATVCCKVDEGRKLLEALRKHSRWGKSVARVLADYPRNLGAGIQPNRREILARGVLQDIHQAALRELEEIKVRMLEGERLLAEGRKILAGGKPDYTQLHVALAAMVELYPNEFPSGEQILKDSRALGRAVFFRIGRHQKPHGLNHLARYRYASARDLVPFVIVLCIEGAFNSDSVLELTLSGIRKRKIMGVDVTEVEAPKNRAKGGIYVKDFDPTVVDPWFALLAKITRPLRNALSEHLRDRLFIFSPQWASKARARAFDHNQGGASNDESWKLALSNFCKRHGIPQFTLSKIRPTLLDQVGQMHGSIAASRAGRHSQFQTFENHYAGPGTHDREREKLGETVQQMERWAASSGHIDVRRAVRPAHWGKSAATPGFECADPHDSPIVGQLKNRLCRAFGSCPTCSLSGADFADALAVAYWLALEGAIYEARNYLDSPHWIDKWAPIAARVQLMLKSVAKPVMDEAQSYSVYVPPVG